MLPLLTHKDWAAARAQGKTVLGLQQWTQVRTPAFKAWFGDSQSVDEAGLPRVLYHGTTVDIDAFVPSTVGTYGAGIYFCDAPSANIYAGEEGGLLVPVFLSIKNPYRLQPDEALEDAYDLDSCGLPLVLDLFEGAEQADVLARCRHRDFGLLTEVVTERLRCLGYDGVIATYEDGCQEWVVFDPEQVKSAYGNSGAFDPDSPSLTDRRDFSPLVEPSPDEPDSP